jgi:Domain of unknown function (DUF932)
MIFDTQNPILVQNLKEDFKPQKQTIWDIMEPVQTIDTFDLFPNVQFAQMPEKALFLPSKNKVLGFVSKAYKVVQNKDVFLPIYESLSEKYGQKNINVNVQSYNDVKHYVSFEVLDRPLEIQKGDLLNPSINVQNSYNGSLPFALNLGMQRLICGNGLKAFESHISFQKKHTQGLEIPFEIVYDSIEAFPNYTGYFQKLMDRKLTSNEVLQLEERIKENTDFPKKYFSDVPLIIHQEAQKLDVSLNAWLVYNGYNHILNHSPLKLPPEQKTKIDRQVLKLVEEY